MIKTTEVTIYQIFFVSFPKGFVGFKLICMGYYRDVVSGGSGGTLAPLEFRSSVRFGHAAHDIAKMLAIDPAKNELRKVSQLLRVK